MPTLNLTSNERPVRRRWDPGIDRIKVSQTDSSVNFSSPQNGIPSPPRCPAVSSLVKLCTDYESTWSYSNVCMQDDFSRWIYLLTSAEDSDRRLLQLHWWGQLLVYDLWRAYYCRLQLEFICNSQFVFNLISFWIISCLLYVDRDFHASRAGWSDPACRHTQHGPGMHWTMVAWPANKIVRSAA